MFGELAGLRGIFLTFCTFGFFANFASSQTLGKQWAFYWWGMEGQIMLILLIVFGLGLIGCECVAFKEVCCPP